MSTKKGTKNEFFSWLMHRYTKVMTLLQSKISQTLSAVSFQTPSPFNPQSWWGTSPLSSCALPRPLALCDSSAVSPRYARTRSMRASHAAQTYGRRSAAPASETTWPHGEHLTWARRSQGKWRTVRTTFSAQWRMAAATRRRRRWRRTCRRENQLPWQANHTGK